MTGADAGAALGSALGTYAVAKSSAVSPDTEARVRLAAGADTPPEILFYLANDPAVTVRAAVAMNEATPVQAAHLLARDEDARVRALVARKLAGLAPGLTDCEQERVRGQTYEALTALVSDEAERVRGALAEVLKEMADAPRDLILALAHDPSVMVSEPVIRLSPLLTQQDLLALVRAAPAPHTVASVARRPNLDETVSDAIAATADVAAIRVLLRNRSAAIRESTLDSLVSQAAEQASWHEPMVQRPKLSARSARKLADIVANNLLEVLASRADLDSSLLAHLRERLDATRPDIGIPVTTLALPKQASAAAVEETAKLQANGHVSEAKLLEAVQRGDPRPVCALVALAAGVPLAVIERAVSLRSAKGLVSLLWKAGFGMAATPPIQTLLLRLPPNEVLTPARGGAFPLALDEMRWQLDFLIRAGR